MSWDSVVLSTLDSLKAIELYDVEYFNETDVDYVSEKIGQAKDQIGTYLSVDVTLDNITNPEVLNLASDYLTLAIMYRDKSNHADAYWNAHLYYNDIYIKELNMASKRIETSDDEQVQTFFGVGMSIR